MKKVFFLFSVALPLLFSSCQEDLLPADDITLQYGEEKRIADSPYGDMSIDNKFVASINGNLIKGRHVGATTAVLKDGREIDITVTSKVKSIKEISREWGASRSSLINISHLGTFEKSSGTGDIWQSLSEDGKILYTYSFTNGALSSSALAVHKSLVSDLSSYIKERFTLVNSSSILQGGYDADNVDDAETYVGITVLNANYYYVAFIPNE